MSSTSMIDFIEFPANDLPGSKMFFTDLMGWSLTDYGPDYTCFNDGRVAGGFFRSEKHFLCEIGAPLVVFYKENLEDSREQVLALGGKICREIFNFPGGKRFHFTDPSGNEFAIWSE